MNNSNNSSNSNSTNNTNSSGSNSTNKTVNKEAMKKFKEEVAGELGINLKQGYYGDLTSKDAGSIGGEMVKQMIRKQEEQM